MNKKFRVMFKKIDQLLLSLLYERDSTYFYTGYNKDMNEILCFKGLSSFYFKLGEMVGYRPRLKG